MINPGFTLPWKSKTIKTNSCLELSITNPLKIYLVVFLHPSEKKPSNWSASPHNFGVKIPKKIFELPPPSGWWSTCAPLQGLYFHKWHLKLPAFSKAAMGNMSFRESLPSLGSHSIGPIAAAAAGPDAPLKTDIWATPEKTSVQSPDHIGSMYGIFTYMKPIKNQPNVGKIYHTWILWEMQHPIPGVTSPIPDAQCYGKFFP